MHRQLVRLLILILTAVIALAVTVACQPTTPAPNPNVNYAPWGHNAATVMKLSAIYPEATPTTYPGHDPSEWAAVDFMLPYGGHTAADIAAGWRLAHEAQAMAVAGGWNVHYVGYQQSIWNIQRAAEGWRPMVDRGSWTQNHRDHVHVSFWN